MSTITVCYTLAIIALTCLGRVLKPVTNGRFQLKKCTYKISIKACEAELFMQIAKVFEHLMIILSSLYKGANTSAVFGRNLLRYFKRPRYDLSSETFFGLAIDQS